MTSCLPSLHSAIFQYVSCHIAWKMMEIRRLFSQHSSHSLLLLTEGNLWGQEVGILSCGIWWYSIIVVVCSNPALPNYKLDSVVFASSYTELSLLCPLNSSDETCITAGAQSSPAWLGNLASKWTKTSDNWETLEGKIMMIIGIYWKSIDSNKNPQITRV